MKLSLNSVVENSRKTHKISLFLLTKREFDMAVSWLSLITSN